MPIPPNDEVKSALKKMMEEREKGVNTELKECEECEECTVGVVIKFIMFVLVFYMYMYVLLF